MNNTSRSPALVVLLHSLCLSSSFLSVLLFSSLSVSYLVSIPILFLSLSLSTSSFFKICSPPLPLELMFPPCPSSTFFLLLSPSLSPPLPSAPFYSLRPPIPLLKGAGVVQARRASGKRPNALTGENPTQRPRLVPPDNPVTFNARTAAQSRPAARACACLPFTPAHFTFN